MPMLNWIAKLVLEWLFLKWWKLMQSFLAAQKQKGENKKLLENYAKAIKLGDKDEIAKAGEDLLNGVNRNNRG